MKEYNLKITTPDRTVFDGAATCLSLRGTEGDLAVMAGHIPFVTAVKEGSCRVYLQDGIIKSARCGAGLLTVSASGVIFLPSEFEWEE